MICLFALLSLVSSSGFASSLELKGDDATALTNILKDAGIGSEGNTLQGFDLVCEAIAFGNNDCLIATSATDPATHRVSVPKNLSGKFWSLMKKAGVPEFVSQASDGTAGKLLITANSVVCSAESDSCIFEVSAQ